METHPGFLAFWGKAGDGGAFHPLACHCLDVAAVGAELLERDPFLVREVASAAGLPGEAVRKSLPLLLALHDLGKFAEAFQDLRPDLAEALQGPRRRLPYAVRHDSLGFSLLAHVVGPELAASGLLTAEGLEATDVLWAIDPWLRAVAGHHGQPPEPVRATLHFSPRSIAAASSFARAAAEVAGPVRIVLPEGADIEAALRVSSWPVAGIAILSDWLGSNVEYFPYESSTDDLAAYWRMAQARARRAVAESGLGPFRSAAAVPVERLFPAITEPSPAQRTAGSAALGHGPQLVVLEDLTGSGKTEAALLFASRLMATGRAAGIYFALPTMATANAMHARLSSVYRRLYDEDAKPPLLLAHSAARLGLEPSREGPFVAADPGGAVTASRWLADSRKKALLAAVGVGTIDQALLAVLTARHGALRLAGLGRNVLIVDEVHAFDAYQSSLLERLLEAQSAVGGSAVLLSATLPARLRARLVSAFRRGLGCTDSSCTSASYPLVTIAGAGGTAETPVDVRTGTARAIPIAVVHGDAEVLERLLSAARSGQCACWIRNTVRDAVKAYQAAAAALGPERVTLFHARFMLGDRLGIESEVLGAFGADSGQGTRAGRIVVATQVVEQSLDLDFDVLATDLAPMDLVIQRSGRFRRHPRRRDGERARVEEREPQALIVNAPRWSELPGQDWVAAALPGTSRVYQDPGVLWLTLRSLREAGAIRVPDEARNLIESVYGAQAAAGVPPGLRARADVAAGEAEAERALARLNAIDLRLGYDRGALGWQEDRIVPTRLGDPTVTLRLARVDGDGLAPLFRGGRGTGDWPWSEVRARYVSVAQRDSPDDDALVERAEDTMPDHGESCLTLVLREDEAGWAGRARDARGRAVIVRYRSGSGLTVERGTRGGL